MKNYLFIIIISIFIPGCSSLTLSTDYDQSIDFSGFKTYRWHADNEHNSAAVSPGRDDSLQKAQGNLPIRSAR